VTRKGTKMKNIGEGKRRCRTWKTFKRGRKRPNLNSWRCLQKVRSQVVVNLGDTETLSSLRRKKNNKDSEMINSKKEIEKRTMARKR